MFFRRGEKYSFRRYIRSTQIKSDIRPKGGPNSAVLIGWTLSFPLTVWLAPVETSASVECEDARSPFDRSDRVLKYPDLLATIRPRISMSTQTTKLCVSRSNRIDALSGRICLVVLMDEVVGSNFTGSIAPIHAPLCFLQDVRCLFPFGEPHQLE